MIDFFERLIPLRWQDLPLFPEQASTVAAEVDALTLVWTAVSAVSIVVIVGAVAYLMVRYRRRAITEIGGGEAHAPLIEILSMVIPFVVVMVMFVWGTKVFIDLKRPPADAIEYLAFGKQWMWKYQHPNGRREINNLTVPLGTPIVMTMTSEDVIHSFYVPAFRVKQDVVPGRYTTVWFEAIKTGVFRQMCAEYCGSEHSMMGGTVTVLPQDQYQTWLLGEEISDLPAVSGERLFTNLACATCHDRENTPRGPALDRLHGSTILLQDGSQVVADDSYLRESILEPLAKVRAGWSPLMPTFQGQVSEEQLFELVSYLKSLSGAAATHDPTVPSRSPASGG